MNERKPLYYLDRIEKNELVFTRWNAARSLAPLPKQLEILHVGSAVLLRDKTDPASSYYNRVKGFGPQDLSELDSILSNYQAAPCFDMTPDHMTEEVAQALSSRGYIPVEQLVFMYADLLERPEVNLQLHIERVTEQTAEEFIRWIGLSMGGEVFEKEAVDRSKAYFYSPNFINYILRMDGAPASMGSLFLNGKEGYIANDYTFEAYRGMGYQGALLPAKTLRCLQAGSRAGIHGCGFRLNQS
jgi:hypothetical protein